MEVRDGSDRVDTNIIDAMNDVGCGNVATDPMSQTEKNSLRTFSDASIFARSYECIACIMLFVTNAGQRGRIAAPPVPPGDRLEFNSITEIQMAAKKARKAAKKGGRKAAKKGAKKGGAKRKAAKKRR